MLPSIPEETAVSEGAESPIDRFEKRSSPDRADIGQCVDLGPIRQKAVEALFETAATEKTLSASAATGARPRGPDAVQRLKARANEAELEYRGRGNWGLVRRSAETGEPHWRNAKGNLNLVARHIQQHGAFRDLREVYRHPDAKTMLFRANDRRNSFIEALIYALACTYLRGHALLRAELDLCPVISGFACEMNAGLHGDVGNQRVGTDSGILAVLYRQGDRAENISKILTTIQKRLALPSAINLNVFYRSNETGRPYKIASFNPSGGQPVFLIYPGAGEGGVHAFVPEKSTGTLVRDLSKLVERTEEREAYERIDENVEYASRRDAVSRLLAFGLDVVNHFSLPEYSFIQALMLSANARYANGLLARREVDERALQIAEAMSKDGSRKPIDDVIMKDAAMASRVIALVGEVFGLPNLKPYLISVEEGVTSCSKMLRCSPLVSEDGLPLYLLYRCSPLCTLNDRDAAGSFEGMSDVRVSAKAICRSDIKIAELKKKLARWGQPVSYGVGDGNDFVRNLVSVANVTFNDEALSLAQVARFVAYLAKRVAEQGVDNLDDAIGFPARDGSEVQRATDCVASELCRFFGRNFGINVHRCTKHPEDRGLLRLEQFPLASHRESWLNVLVNDAVNDRSKRYSVLVENDRITGLFPSAISNVTKRLSELRAQEVRGREEAAQDSPAVCFVSDEKPETSAASRSKGKGKAKKKHASRPAQLDPRAQPAARLDARSEPDAEALSGGVAGRGVEPGVTGQAPGSDRAPQMAQPAIAAQPAPGATAGPEQSSALRGDGHEPPSLGDTALSSYGARGRDVFSAAELEMSAGAEAQRMLQFAVTEEPVLTATFQEVAKEHGGRLVALENRLKSEDSLRRKIVARAGQRIVLGEPMDVFVRKACVNINDVLRYTAELPTDRYWKAFDASVESLAQHGVKQLYLFDGWKPDSPFIGTYRGINATFQSPNGLLVELQVHTPESFTMRNELHAIYEEARSASTSPERRAELEAFMRERWMEAPEPHADG